MQAISNIINHSHKATYLPIILPSLCLKPFFDISYCLLTSAFPEPPGLPRPCPDPHHFPVPLLSNWFHKHTLYRIYLPSRSHPVLHFFKQLLCLAFFREIPEPLGFPLVLTLSLFLFLYFLFVWRRDTSLLE